jgi:hypothetical protein
VNARPTASRPIRARIAAVIGAAPAALEPHLGEPGFDRVGRHPLLRLLRFRDPGRQRGVELLPDPRHGEEELGTDGCEVGRDLLRVRTERDVRRVRDVHVVADHAFGDVRERQIGDLPAARRRRPDAIQRLDRPADVAVRDHHALRRPGRPRGVDQRAEPRRLDRLPARAECGRPLACVGAALLGERLERDHPVAALARDFVRALEEDHLPHRRNPPADREELAERRRVLREEERTLAVADDVLDLLRRERVVERDGRPCRVQDGEVGDHVFRPVRGEEVDELAGLQAERGEPIRDVADALAVGPPGEPAPATVLRLPAHRLAIRFGGDRRLKRVADGPSFDRRIDLAPFREDVSRHELPPLAPGPDRAVRHRERPPGFQESPPVNGRRSAASG